MSALIELKVTEPARRWFSSIDMDLIVWFDPDDSIVSFELYYDKNIREHVIAWHAERGFSHLAVDDGEQKPALNYKESPILIPDGHIDPGYIRDQFEASCDNLPASIVAVVRQRLAQHLNITH